MARCCPALVRLTLAAALIHCGPGPPLACLQALELRESRWRSGAVLTSLLSRAPALTSLSLLLCTPHLLADCDLLSAWAGLPTLSHLSISCQQGLNEIQGSRALLI